MLDDDILRIAAQGFAVALTTALVVMPLCAWLAVRCGVVDKPGGRKTHVKVTPLLGGAGVVLAVAAGFLVVWGQSERLGHSLDFGQIGFVIAGSLVLFVIGLIDDVFKDSMAFQPKLVGQVIGVVVLMWPTLHGLIEHGGPPRQWLYQLFFLGWYLTIVNSLNFSDNMNGLMSGLSVIAFAAAVFYLQNTASLRSMMVAVLLMGGLLGFMPYNFPRSRLFLGDAGSMFVGFWMAWIMFDLTAGFMSVGRTALGGAHQLIPAVLIMGLPLYDAVFVVFMRIVERRPVYLGDNHHLSHRLVRGGFTPAEAVAILWGLAFILASVGSLAAEARPTYRYLIFVAAFVFMVAVTRAIMALERVHGQAARARSAGGDDDPGGGLADDLDDGAAASPGRADGVRSAR